jgi:hypothetical protein
MKYYYLIIALTISLLAHLFFFSNIHFSFNNITSDEHLFIEMIPIPANSINNDLKKIHKIKNNKKPMESQSKVEETPSKISESYLKEEINKTEICELCQPVEEIIIPEIEKAYGNEIQSIIMQYIVFHELPPNKGNINNFTLFGDRKNKNANVSNRSEVGILNIEYVIDKNSYTIRYEAKANGITSLIYSKSLIQRSEGVINEDGIRPNYYLYKYGDKLKNEAFFDWDTKKLKITRQNKENFFDLSNGTQDQLSFMFQFMFLNPLDKMQIPITNAKIFKTYNYQYIKEGQMKSNIGNIDYIHVAKFNYQDPERIDLWLAKDYGFLPFKVSITDEDLSTITQDIFKIQVEKNDE